MVQLARVCWLIFMLYAILLVIGKSTHLFFLADIAQVCLGFLFDTLLIFFFLLALLKPNNAFSGNRLFWSRTILILILFGIVCSIGYYQLHFLERAWLHFISK